MTELNHKKLYEMLELPKEVVVLLNTYAAQRTQEIPEEIYHKLCVREEWDAGVKELQSYLGDDSDYPEWKDVKLTCDTWMLMPELQAFPGESSRIVGFQKMFEIEQINREETWYMGWIFPGYDTIDDKLPEKTLLQRELKKYLLAGNKFGIARGIIINRKNECLRI